LVLFVSSSAFIRGIPVQRSCANHAIGPQASGVIAYVKPMTALPGYHTQLFNRVVRQYWGQSQYGIKYKRQGAVDPEQFAVPLKLMPDTLSTSPRVALVIAKLLPGEPKPNSAASPSTGYSP
jgi:hypothetical protein